jgi:uncharacterized protein YbcI
MRILGRAGTAEERAMPHPQPSRPSRAGDDDARPSGGTLLSAISNSISALRREHYGRGPLKAKTYILDDIIIVVMRDLGYSAIEKTMIENDEAERVIALREDFQRVMSRRYSAAIETLTGRTVVAFLNRAHLEPDLSMKVFIIDRPLDAFGVSEVISRQGRAEE